MKRLLEAVILLAVGAILGALAQAAAQLDQERERPSYCSTLYDQSTEAPGVERVTCDPVDGAR